MEGESKLFFSSFVGQLDVRHISVWQNERKLSESRWNLLQLKIV